MKSPLRIAYDSLQEIEDRDDRLLTKFTPQSYTPRKQVCPSVAAQIIEDEMRDLLVYTHPKEVAFNHEENLKYSQDRYAVSQKLLKEWEDQKEERSNAIAELFKLLTEEEKQELMLKKLSR
jgi:hypothetical protein